MISGLQNHFDALDLLRKAIEKGTHEYDEILKFEIELDESFFEGNEKEKRQTRCRDNDSNRNTGKRWKSFHGNREICNCRDSHERDCDEAALMYTDKWKGCDSPMVSVYRHLNIDHKYKFKEGKVSSMKYCDSELCERTANRVSKDI